MPILKNVKINGSDNVTILVFNKDVGLLAHSDINKGRIHISLNEDNKEDPAPAKTMNGVDVILDFYGPAGLRSFINYLEKVHKKAEKNEKE